jgi:IPT/TIG domain
MGRSQRHMLEEQGANAAGNTLDQGAVAEGLLAQTDGLTRSPKSVDIPTGDPGGPLQGSTLTGAIPEDIEDVVGGGTPPEPDVTPVLTSLSPNTGELNSADITMHCIGTGFTETSVINFAGNDELTVFVSDTDITTIITMSLPWGAVTVPVTVKNGTAESAPLDFTFTEAVAPLATKSRKKSS